MCVLNITNKFPLSKYKQHTNSTTNWRLMITVRAKNGRSWWGVVKMVFTIQIEFGKQFRSASFFLHAWQLHHPSICKHLWLYYIVDLCWPPPAAIISDWVRGVFNWKWKHKQYQLMTIEMASFSFFLSSFSAKRVRVCFQVNDWIL